MLLVLRFKQVSEKTFGLVNGYITVEIISAKVLSFGHMIRKRNLTYGFGNTVAEYFGPGSSMGTAFAKMFLEYTGGRLGLIGRPA